MAKKKIVTAAEPAYVQINDELALQIANATGLTYLTDNLSKLTINKGQEFADILRYYATSIETRTMVDADILPAIKANNAGFDYDVDEEQSEKIVVAFATLTIAATPEDSIVTMNGEAKTSIEVEVGSTVQWSVEKEGFETQTGEKVVEADDTLTIELVAIAMPTE